MDQVLRALTNAGDTRVTSLVGDRVSEFISLVSPHLHENHGEFEFRYLSPGKSGAFVLLVVFADALALVIKVGPKELIEREVKNYSDYQLSSYIPSEFILQIVGPLISVGDRASIAFYWAGGRSRVASLRDCLFELQPDQVAQLLAEASDNLFRWQRVGSSASSPLDLFRWDQEAKSKIAEVLNSVERTQEREILLKFLNRESTVRDSFQQISCSLGFTHGDLHGGNLLVVGDHRVSQHLRIIDFASVQRDMCPARDWAKLERDVRFRCRRPASVEALHVFADLLQESLEGKKPVESDVQPAVAAILKIRDQYKLHCHSASGDWEAEYLYFLLCWCLNELHSNPLISSAGDRLVVARTCGMAARSLMRKSGPRDQYTVLEHKREDKVTSAFLADTRIAGYVRRKDGTERALYLDAGLYVPRRTAEDRIDEILSEYVIDGKGRWVSIFGDAGHGKTSLMWHLAAIHASRDVHVLPIQCQQLGEDAMQELLNQIEGLRSHRTVVLLDTLDMLIGVKDQGLASALSQLRAGGLLLISASRRQEIQELAKHILWDDSIELARFDEAEARMAVQKYVDAAYEGLSEERRSFQFTQVWEMLDHQRKFQDLTFEPLILRMIFQAYVPDDIPQDINTQRVYDKFWSERVLSDRSAKSSADSLRRSQACELIADAIGFREGAQRDTLPYADALLILRASGTEDPSGTIESLMSTGVLRWSRGKSAVGFFHQTFLEYSAARAILFMEDEPKRRARISLLFEDLRESRLFRLPILKQLAIQAHQHSDELWLSLARGIEEIGNQAAAKLALEVAGKIKEDSVFYDSILRWAERGKELFKSVSVEIVRAYPVARFAFAFQLLEPQLDSEREGDIYFICQKVFAPADPEQTLAFLKKAARNVRAERHDRNAAFRQALFATLREGRTEALKVLTDVFPLFGDGMQEAVLQDILELARPEHAEGIGGVLFAGASLVLEGKKRKFSSAYYDLLRWLYVNSPSKAKALIETVETRSHGNTDVDIAILLAKSRAVVAQSRESLIEALNALASPDHLTRMANCEFLGEVARHSGGDVLDAILQSADSPLWSQPEATRFLLLALRTMRVQDASRILAVLTRWPFPERGAGNAFRAVFTQLAKADPNIARDWLMDRKEDPQSEGDVRRVMVGVQLLAEESPLVMSEADLRAFVEVGMRRSYASFETGRIACTVLGRCFSIAPDYCKKEIVQVVTSGNREWISATIKALAGNKWTGLPLFVLRLILKREPNRSRDLFIGLLLEATNGLPPLAKVELLTELSNHASTVLPTIKDENAQLHVLILAKSTAKQDPVTALTVAKALPCQTTATLGELLAVYENITFVSSDPVIYRQALGELLRISHHRQRHIRNSLRRALPRIEEVLGPRVAVDAVKTAVRAQGRWDDGALEDLLRAAVAIPSWTHVDSEELLAQGLPNSVSAILLRAPRT